MSVWLELLIVSLIFSIFIPVLIGLISDTHIATPHETLPVQVKESFRGVDLILHAGDIWVPSVLDELESVAPVMAAWGDDDMEADLGRDCRMMKGHTMTLEGVNLWVTHVKPRYSRINPQEHPYSAKFNNNHDFDKPPDIVVFGHTHFATVEPYKGVLLVNPGSATVPSYVPRLGTVGFLSINGGEVSARIVQLQ